MSPFPHLETRHLLLREITEADAPELLRIHGDADHMRWFGSDPPTGLDGAKQLVQTFASWRQEPASGTRWGLQLKAAPGLIGTCGLFRWNRKWKTCVVGYEISPEHQGRGYMKEALATAFAWGFAELGLNRIEAHVHPDNLRSRDLLQRFGFVEEGRLREVGYWAGSHHDLLLCSLLRRDWAGGAAA